MKKDKPGTRDADASRVPLEAGGHQKQVYTYGLYLWWGKKFGHGVTKQQKIKIKQFKQRSKNNKICRGRCRLAGTTYVATRVPASRVTGFARVQILVPVPVPQLTRDVNPCGSRYPCHSLVNGVLRYTGLRQTLKLVIAEEGTRALYSGLSAHLMRVLPNAVIMFAMSSATHRVGWFLRPESPVLRLAYCTTS